MSNALSLQLITDAVMAEYIHEISPRHRPPEPEPSRPQDTRSGPGAVVDAAARMFV